MHPSLMTELAHAIMEDRRREAKQYRLARRNRPRRRDKAHTRLSDPRSQPGPRDTRPRGRRRQRRASTHRTQHPTG